MNFETGLRLASDLAQALGKKRPALNPDDYGIQSERARWLLIWSSDLYHLSLVVVHLPLLWLFLELLFNALGPNAIQGFHFYTGTWALRFLLITLAITPIQTVTRWRGMTPYRQLFGLASFFYAALHVYGYLWIDQALNGTLIWRDLLESPYLWPGLFAFGVIVPLALTSPNQAKKWMGRRWKKLHRWVFPASIAVILHAMMQLKGNLADPLMDGLLLFSLLFFRLGVWFKNRQLAKLMIPGAPRRRALPDALDDPPA